MATKKSTKKRSSREQKSEAREAEEELSPLRRIWDQVGTLVVAVGLALLLRAMVIESYYVPSGSMLPTMLIGDHVFVNKFAYGAKIPFTDTHLPALRDPERGEIVIFALGRRGPSEICPLDRCPDYPAEGFVKRLVGLPGDTVEVRNGVVKVNGETLPIDYEGRFPDDHGRELRLGEEELLGCGHEVLEDPASPGLNVSRLTVPEGRYFMMGDNRDHSNDSRRWGTVARNDLKGPVIGIYWSWNNTGSWLSMANPLTWIRLLAGETRWGRVGMGLRCEDVETG